MLRLTRALGALVVSTLVAAGLTVGLGAPAHAKLPCLADVLQATSAPVIAGSGAVGSPVELTQMPAWNCDLVTTSVQWFNSSGAISGATGTSYTPVADDAGGAVLAMVTGSVVGLLPVSVPSNVVPVPSSGGGSGGGTGDPGDPGTDLLTLLGGLDLPGSAEVGQLITLTDPVWSLPGVTTTYQWLRDGAPIPGADGQSYVPGLDDAGHAISAQVTGTLLGVPGVTVVTDALDIPLASGTQVSPTGDVTIRGSKKVGTALTLSGPTWDPSDATSKYQWFRDSAPIGGATAATYTLTAADFGHDVAVTVTGHKEGYTDNTITSAAIQPVVGDPIQFVMKPGVTGTGKVGRLLTADPGQWTGGTEGSGLPTYTYQWLRDGTAIPGAVAQTYQVDKADVGRDLAVLVTATRPAYKAGKFTTAPVHVAKLASSLRATLAKKTVARGRAASMTLVLTVPGMGSPTGAVKVMDGARVVKKAAFAAGRHGVVVVRLTKLKPGVHKLRAVYAGSTTVAGATSKVVRLTVLT